MSKRRDSNVFWLLAVPTVGLFYLALWLTIHIRYPHGLASIETGNHYRTFSVIYAIWLVIFFSYRLFDLSVLRRYTTLLFSLLSAYLIGLIGAIIYLYLQPTLILTPRRFLLIDVLVSFVLTAGWYLFVKVFLAKRTPEQVYLLTLVDEHNQLAKEIKQNSYLGYELKGYLRENDLAGLATDEEVSIIFPDELQNRPDLLAKFYDLRKRKIGFYSQHDFYEQLTRTVDLSNINEYWFLANINYQAKRRFYNLAKRSFDFLFGILMLIIFVITWPFIALGIKLSSKGSLFFIQQRIGQNDEPFYMYKYRTMLNGPGNTWTQDRDPRITFVGKFLRRTRLDELPQFINLIQGNMSLVGPRPEQVHIVNMLKKEIPFFDERHLVKPGLTGWAQLNVYASTLGETKLKLQYDLYYIKHQSFLFDLEIILKTAYHVIVNKGR
jgi:exopolysaccharide biosynthesis polyprenyl glycosylphosphotransferase